MTTPTPEELAAEMYPVNNLNDVGAVKMRYDNAAIRAFERHAFLHGHRLGKAEGAVRDKDIWDIERVAHLAGDAAGYERAIKACTQIFESWALGKQTPSEIVAAIRALSPTSPAPSAGERARYGIYIASKTKHAERWRYLRDKVGEPIISTWIDEAGEGESADLNDLWHRCIREASSAEVLILYREKDDVLKGGWIELGAALASGVPIFAIGIEEFTVANHDGIRHFPDMKTAIAASRKLRRSLAATPAKE